MEGRGELSASNSPLLIASKSGINAIDDTFQKQVPLFLVAEIYCDVSNLINNGREWVLRFLSIALLSVLA